MRSLVVMSVVLVLVDRGLAKRDPDEKKPNSDVNTRPEKPSASMLEIPKSALRNVGKAEEGTVVVGPYETKKTSYTYKGMNSTSQKIDVWYPVGGAGQKFPFISYAHGRFYGGPLLEVKYSKLLHAISAFGYVIAAHESCDSGCVDGNTLPQDPTGFGAMYEEQLKVIEWAKQQGKTVFKFVNFDIGVGISGHSMGGQATMYSSSAHGSGRDIKAAVMHQAYTHTYPPPLVPFLAFTGTKDVIAPPFMSKTFFDAEDASPTRGFVKKTDGTHLEPQENPQMLAAYTAAWFKLFLDNTPREDRVGGDSVDYHAMIFGNGTNSLCHGGYGPDPKAEDCIVYEVIP